MALTRTLRQLPMRLTAGAYMLNSGVQKWQADEQTAGELHGFASSAYPFVKEMDPPTFLRVLAGTEIALGAALVLPMVPALFAGAGLAAFSTGLLGLYLKTPGMRQEGSLRPTQQGTPLAKDVWLLGIGAGLVVDDLTAKD
jgi:uncharacterized membrane protein YphA (DoxX/SURF4 family)